MLGMGYKRRGNGQWLKNAALSYANCRFNILTAPSELSPEPILRLPFAEAVTLGHIIGAWLALAQVVASRAVRACRPKAFTIVSPKSTSRARHCR
jgi:hypothetical protein